MDTKEKNLISRRTLLNNSLLTGLSIVTGLYVTKPQNILHAKAKKPDGDHRVKKDLTKSNSKTQKDTYIEYFDC